MSVGVDNIELICWRTLQSQKCQFKLFGYHFMRY